MPQIPCFWFLSSVAFVSGCRARRDHHELEAAVHENTHCLLYTSALSNTLMEQYRIKQASGLLPKESIADIAERLKSEMLVI